MMIYPPIAKLVDKTGSRYTLVIEVAKRARQLAQGSEALSKSDSNKEVSVATCEVFEDKLEVFSRPSIASLEEAAEAVLVEPETVSEDLGL